MLPRMSHDPSSLSCLGIWLLPRLVGSAHRIGGAAPVPVQPCSRGDVSFLNERTNERRIRARAAWAPARA
eukprot:4960549-Pyramimonas_sp.AAC.1